MIAKRSGLPEFFISSRQRSVPYDAPLLDLLVKEALPFCMEISDRLGGPLSNLERLEFTIVGNRLMARVHREFLDIRGTTDVITFPYGEILLCAPVAKMRAKEFGVDVTTEIALYCIHGLLHLAGHDDIVPEAALLMTADQERILRNAREAAGKQATPNPDLMGAIHRAV